MTRMSGKLDATMVFFAGLLLEPDVYKQADHAGGAKIRNELQHHGQSPPQPWMQHSEPPQGEPDGDPLPEINQQRRTHVGPVTG
jgi:hypothetical protein